MIRKKRIWISIKYFLYLLILIVLYAMQTTAGFFSFFGVRPIWVLPFAVAISMCEDVVSAAVFGSLSGLLCDLGSQALFGFNGLLVPVSYTHLAMRYSIRNIPFTGSTPCRKRRFIPMENIPFAKTILCFLWESSPMPILLWKRSWN